MTLETLQTFCHPRHTDLCAPFSYGDFTYATDGKIIVRVPRIDSVSRVNKFGELAANTFKGVNPDALLGVMVNIPDYKQPPPTRCPDCGGTGKISICPECEGAGIVTLSTDFNEYECRCESCHGTGKARGGEPVMCLSCHGAGHRWSLVHVDVGDVVFSNQYLNMMRHLLPGVKIAPTYSTLASYFSFDGGDGLLVPVRKDSK